MLLVLLLCGFCTVFYTIVSFRHFILKREFDGFFIVSLLFDLVFGIFPTVISWQVVFDGSQSAYIKSILDMSEEGIIALIYYYVMALIGFCGIILGYFGRIKKPKNIASFGAIELKSSKFNNNLMLFRVVPYFSIYDIILGFFPLTIMIVIYKFTSIVDYTIKKRG